MRKRIAGLATALLCAALVGCGAGRPTVTQHSADAYPDRLSEWGAGLRALRDYAHAAGRALLHRQDCGIQLWGYLNDDSLPEVRPYFVLVYELRAPAGTEAPPAMSWIGGKHLNGVPLDPVSLLLVEAVEARVAS